MAKVNRGEFPNNYYLPYTNFGAAAEPFNNLVKYMGYNIKLYKNVLCPCQLTDEVSPQASCSNCRGTGTVFFNPVETRAIITSLNYKSQYHEWSTENMGTASITTYATNELSYMDKIEILDVNSTHNELCKVVESQDGSTYYTYLNYRPIEVTEIFLYESSTEPLTFIKSRDYTLTEYGIEWNTDEYVGRRVSIRYKHHPEYLIVDLPHNIRQSPYQERSGHITQKDFPVMGVGKLAHFTLDMPNYDGSKNNTNNTPEEL